ncbi:MAG: hypothetical protein O7E52_00310 [Candidatus Poribacteria bacterium]|nr:hypothetical protein [Candidatus Poribacteria bacterium]
MIPAEVVLSPETYQKIVEESNIQQEIRTGKDPVSVLRNYFSIPITIREENADLIIAKELFPNPCPVCGRRIPFLREMIERIESRSIKRIRCPLGHRYEGEIKVYYLNIFQEDQTDPKAVQTCPQCGSKNVQYLSQTDVFCLNCEWDNLKLIRGT